MCPFYYKRFAFKGKCVLIEKGSTFERFDVYCIQDGKWVEKFGQLSCCPFQGKDEEKKCSHRNMYQDWIDREKIVSRLENKGF